MSQRSGSSEDSATNKRSFPRRLCWLVLWPALLILLAFGASNLWLISSWGRGMVQGKLEDRTGFVWQLGAVTWSPWNGCTISDIRIRQPEEWDVDIDQPLVVIERVRVRPHWRHLLRGGMRPREVIVESPGVTVPVELLAALRTEVTPVEEPPAAEPPPTLAARNASQGPMAARPPVQPPAGLNTLPAKRPAPPKPAPPKAKRPAAGLPMHLKVKGASVRVVSLGRKRDFLRMSRVSMDLPLFGEDAAGHVKVSGVDIPGVGELPGFEQDIVWKRPHLEIEEQALEVGGLKLRFHARLIPKQAKDGNFPYLVEAVLDPQQVESVALFEHAGLKLGAGKMVARFKLLGLATNPMTWQGDLLVLGEGISLSRPQAGNHVVFDTLHLPAVLRGGKLYWSDAKMVGEDFSILGNGRVSMSGGIVAVTRLVASPEIAVEISKGLHNAGIAEGRWWYDMDTPDRKVRDLTVSGSLFEPVVDAGPGHARLPLARLLGPIFDTASPERAKTGVENAQAKALPPNGSSESKHNEDH